MIIVEDNDIYPIEIKKAKQPSSPDKNFSALSRLKQNIMPGLIICMSDKLIPYNREA